MAEPLVAVAARILPETVGRVDRLADALGKLRPGERVKRSDALRVAIERGVDVMERELALTAAAPAAPSKASTTSAKPAQKGAAKPARKPAEK